MKRALVLFLTICITACSNEVSVERENNPLNGEWVLTNVSCFCFFPNPPDFNLTFFNFNTRDNTLTVTHFGDSNYFREEGTYSYTISGNRITLTDGRSYDYTIQGNTLSLVFVDEPNIADDEILYSMVRS
ncbi:lipocalin family protein [Flagellimonas sp.]|uniref:lipocalin family protein n=1 Tax=Flagellimonas sp. TaxID=2058762 RepID=UPI003F4A0A12